MFFNDILPFLTSSQEEAGSFFSTFPGNFQLICCLTSADRTIF